MIPASESPVRVLRTLIGIGLAAILALHVYLAATGAPRFRDQHLGAALNYAAHGIDLLHPVIVGFTATNTPTPQEVPLWQAVTALALRWSGGWWGWGNIVAWAMFASCIWPFFQLARVTLGERAAAWSVLVFLLQPLVVLHAGQAGTDGTALAAVIWFVYFARQLATSGSWLWCLATALAGALAATQKLPFFLATAIAAMGLALGIPAGRTRRIGQMALAVGVAGVSFWLWTRHCEQQFARAELPFVDLRTSEGTPMRDWYFGSWAQRLDARSWATGGYRVVTGVFGSFALVPFALAGALLPGRRLALWWLAGSVGVTLVFTNLVLQHWHYYLMICPATALLAGAAIAALQSRLATRTESGMFVGAATLALVLASVQGIHASRFLMRDDYARRTARILYQHTSVSDRILIAGGGWGGEELMLSGRQGLSIAHARVLENPDTLARVRGLGFTTLALASQSPLQAAVAMVGGSQSKRREWTELSSPLTEQWPVVFQSADLLVARIPKAADPALKTP